jgi:uncharacterized protein (DUF488 family)
VQPLFTQGYERSTLVDFIGRLKSRRVECVIDVRALPLSRRKGFSKTALAGHLAAAGIEYRHVRELGAPKPLRDAVKAGGAWGDYEKGYRDVLAAQTRVLRELTALGAEKRLCLVCFERDPAVCHRRLVAEAMAALSRGNLSVEHIRY